MPDPFKFELVSPERLLVSDEVRDLFLYEHTVGAERIGAALDCLLGSYDNMVAHTPSVLRRRLLALAAVLRVEQPGSLLPYYVHLRSYCLSGPEGRR